MSNDINKKKIMNEISVNDFVKLNGAIMRTVSNLGNPWFKGDNLKVVFKDKDDELYKSLDYLQQCGFITVRVCETKDCVEVYDFDLEDIEIRLSADGIKLISFVKKDDLIDI